MHYETTGRAPGLKFDPFKALAVPRPIGWIATLGPDGVPNLAPYSFFNAISDRPPMVMFSSSMPAPSGCPAWGFAFLDAQNYTAAATMCSRPGSS